MHGCDNKKQQEERRQRISVIAQQILQRTIEAVDVEKRKRSSAYTTDMQDDIQVAENAMHIVCHGGRMYMRAFPIHTRW